MSLPSRAHTRAALMLLIAVGPAAATSHTEYCAYNPLYFEACFPSQGEAENWLYKDINGVYGRDLLRPSSHNTPYSWQGFLGQQYDVPFFSWNETQGTWHAAWQPTQGNPLRIDCSGGCTSEGNLVQALVTHYGGSKSVTSSGNYASLPGWTGLGDVGNRGKLQANYTIAPPDGRKFDIENGESTWWGEKWSHHLCPPTTRPWPEGAIKNGVPAAWPVMCTNDQTGTLRSWVRQVEHKEVCNPCIPATGGKTLHETDFTWEGLTFQRHYHSIRDVPSKGHIGPAWSHSFSWRLHANDPYASRVDIQSDRNTIEVYQQVNGSAVFRPLNGDQGRLVKGTNGSQVEWTLYTEDGEQRVFDASGFLVALRFPDTPERDLTVDYCTYAEFKQDVCSAPTTIQKVISARGRTLAFAYERATPVAPTLGTRVVAIVSDAGVLVEYGYGLGNRLETVSYPNLPNATVTRTYVYNEPDHICKQGDGSASPNCTWTDFPFLLTGIVDETGTRFSDYTYDQAGRVTRSVNAGGARLLRLEYVNGHYAKVTLPSGGVRHYQYTRPADFFSKPSSVTDGTGTQSFTYQSDGRLATSTDERGTQTVYEYDATYRKAVVEANGTALQRRIETDWNGSFHRPAEARVRDAAGTVKQRRIETFNTRGQNVSTTIIDPATGRSRTTTTTFCEAADVALPQPTCPKLGFRKTLDGPRSDVSDVTTFRYYPATDESGCDTGDECHRQGDLWQVVNALGQVTTTYLRYDRHGRVVRLQDANAVVSDLEYHPRGWLVAQKVRGANATSEADDAITRYEYDAVGQVTATVDPDGVRMEYEYDPAHRLVAIENVSGHRLEYTLDASGNRTAEHSKDATGVVRRSLSRTFDAWSRLDHELDAYGRVADHDYSATHDWDSVKDALVHTTRNEHDPLGRLQKTIEDYTGLNVSTQYGYDVLDQLVSVTDPKGLVSQYGYDALGNLTQLSSPDTGVTTYEVDAAGNRIAQVDARGVTTEYSYDPLGRLTEIIFPKAEPSVTFEYDAVNADCGGEEQAASGRLTRFVDASGETRFCYDGFGHLRRKVQVTAGLTQTVRYGLTLGGRLMEVIYPSGTRVTYGRGLDGRVRSVAVSRPGSSTQTVVDSVGYLPFGPLSSLTYVGGRTQQRQYDANYGIDAILNGLGVGHELDYTLDAVGNPVQISSGAVGNQYAYDPLYRLTFNQSLTGTPVESFTYDGIGNRLSKTVGTGPQQNYTYPAASHRLESVGGVARSYDAGGSLIDRGDGWTYSYDAGQRLQTASYQGAVQQTNAYNAKGERVYVAGGVGLGGVAKRYYAYDEEGRLIAEYQRSGLSAPQLQREYIWLEDLPVAVQVEAGAHAGEVLSVFSDHLGTPHAAVRSSGQVVWTWSSTGSAFGEHAANGDPDGDGLVLEFGLRFPGQQFDAITGLNYNYFRTYEPSTGRFLESDPLGLAGGVSTFGYAEANPVRLIDSLGLSSAVARPAIPGPATTTPGRSSRILRSALLLPNPYLAGLVCLLYPTPAGSLQPHFYPEHAPEYATGSCNNGSVQCMAKGGSQNKANEYSREATAMFRDPNDQCEWLREMYRQARARKDAAAALKIRMAQKFLGCHTGYKDR